MLGFLAYIFHWPPESLERLTWTKLLFWYERAVEISDALKPKD